MAQREIFGIIRVCHGKIIDDKNRIGAIKMGKKAVRARIICGALSVAAVLAVPVAPWIALESVKTVEYVAATVTENQLTAGCEGEIRSKNRSELYLTSPVYVSEVYVEIGDEVKKGDALFKVDGELTEAVLSQSYSQAEEAAGYGALLEKYGAVAQALAQEAPTAQRRELKSIPEVVYSPFSGVITALEAHENRMCASASPLAVFEDAEERYALLSINERYAGQITEGMRVELKDAAAGGNALTATVRKVYPEAKKALRGSAVETVVSFEAEPNEESAGRTLVSGSTVEAKVYLGEPYRCITLPYGCIRQDGGGEYIYLIRDGRAVKSRIETVREFAYCAEVRGDIVEGDRAIYRPDGVTDGMRVYRTAEAEPSEEEL